MAIDAVVANMDTVWTGTGEGTTPVAMREQTAALKHFLEGVRDDG